MTRPILRTSARRRAALVASLATAAILAIVLPVVAQGADEDALRYCRNIQDDAREERYALLDRHIVGLREELDGKREALEARSAELAEWVERREAFLALADDQLVAIYGAMRPDTAGEQIALLDPTVGAAILIRLKPRRASAVLAAMSSEDAAALASIIAASRAGASAQ